MPRLSDISGQPQAVRVLQRAAAAGRVAHAYLFAGPEGVGKATCARALAAALNCHERPGDGCHHCPACDKIARDLHPDLVRLEPDGALIKIDQVRALEQHLAFRPHEGRYRLVLIDGAEKLNINAANALLKSVEEPGARTVFVLVTPAPHRVAVTLVSRCQRIRFLPLAPPDLAAVLERCSDADAGERQAAVAYAEGSAGRALRLLEGDQIKDLTDLANGLLRAAGSGQMREAFEVAAGAGRDRQQILEALEVLRIQLRDRLLDSAGAGGGGGGSRPTLLAQLRAVDEAQAAVLGNVHATLALENLVLGLREAGGNA
jgi:DNA polymerase-3 subunit delta'